MLPSASQRGLPVISARLMPTSANEQADERAGVLEQHDGQLGALGGADEAPPRTALRDWDRPRACAVRSDRPSSTIATPSTPNAQIGDSSSCGSMSFSTPSYNANSEPRVNSTARRRTPRSSAPCRSRTGARPWAALRLRLPPRNSRPWLPVSATEWIDSASIDADPVITNAGELRRARCRGWRGTRRRSPGACPQSDIAHRPTPPWSRRARSCPSSITKRSTDEPRSYPSNIPDSSCTSPSTVVDTVSEAALCRGAAARPSRSGGGRRAPSAGAAPRGRRARGTTPPAPRRGRGRRTHRPRRAGPGRTCARGAGVRSRCRAPSG